jgi:hypothetical protein
MATWTNVSSTVLEPGDPIRSVDIIAIKENIIALSEGASGAPKIAAAALNTGTNEMNWVLARYASASFGAIGTYIIAIHSTLNLDAAFASVGPNTTVAGSVLQRSADATNTYGINVMSASSQSNSSDTAAVTSLGLSGTWRILTHTRSQTAGGYGSTRRPLVFAVRIS